MEGVARVAPTIGGDPQSEDKLLSHSYKTACCWPKVRHKLVGQSTVQKETQKQS